MPTTGAFDNSRNGPFRGSRFWKFSPPPVHFVR